MLSSWNTWGEHFRESTFWGKSTLRRALFKGRALWGEHFLRGEHLEESTFLWGERFRESTFWGESTLGRALYCRESTVKRPVLKGKYTKNRGEHIFWGRALWGEHFSEGRALWGEHFLGGEHFRESTLLGKSTLGRALIFRESTLGRALFFRGEQHFFWGESTRRHCAPHTHTPGVKNSDVPSNCTYNRVCFEFCIVYYSGFSTLQIKFVNFSLKTHLYWRRFPRL